MTSTAATRNTRRMLGFLCPLLLERRQYALIPTKSI
jgi:hypothetical protein